MWGAPHSIPHDFMVGMKSLRDKIVEIIWTATENYEMGAEPSCGSVADAIIDLIGGHMIDKEYLSLLYEFRFKVLEKKTTLESRKEFDGSEGSCDSQVHYMQLAEVNAQFTMIEQLITMFLKV